MGVGKRRLRHFTDGKTLVPVAKWIEKWERKWTNCTVPGRKSELGNFSSPFQIKGF